MLRTLGLLFLIGLGLTSLFVSSCGAVFRLSGEASGSLFFLAGGVVFTGTASAAHAMYARMLNEKLLAPEEFRSRNGATQLILILLAIFSLGVVVVALVFGLPALAHYRRNEELLLASLVATVIGASGVWMFYRMWRRLFGSAS